MIQSINMKKTMSLVVGNWKMNPATMDEASVLVSTIVKKNKENKESYVAIAPPFLYLSEASKKIKNSKVLLAAQNVYHKNIGAYTGEVSALQLKDLGVGFIIIGHSERRANGETNEDVNLKTQSALKYRLSPIVCIGEKERDENGYFFTFVENQIRSLASVLSPEEFKKIIIAYEPIWAIGTGNTATEEDVKEMQLFIESILTKLYDRQIAKSVRLIYGGSVKPSNAFSLHQEGGMNGFLVGSSSLKAEEFLEIIKAVS